MGSFPAALSLRKAIASDSVGVEEQEMQLNRFRLSVQNRDPFATRTPGLSNPQEGLLHPGTRHALQPALCKLVHDCHEALQAHASISGRS